MVTKFCIFLYGSEGRDMFEGELESCINSMSERKVLPLVITHVNKRD